MLVLVAYVLSKGDGYSLYSAAADGLRRTPTLGVLVFIVVVLRLLWRLIDSTPAKQPMPRWMDAAAKLVQFALYVLLIAISATAVLGTWLEGIPITFPGFDIAPQITKAHGLGQLIMKTHTTLGNASSGSPACMQPRLSSTTSICATKSLSRWSGRMND